MRTLEHNTGEREIDLELLNATVRDVKRTQSEGVRWIIDTSQAQRLIVDLGLTAETLQGPELNTFEAEWVGRILKGGFVRENGALELELLGGPTLVVLPATAYESWTAFRSDGFGVVCMPGGEVAVFIPSDGGDRKRPAV